MSIDTSTTRTISLQIPNYKPVTEVATQHGMRYPDGSILWVTEPSISSFELLHSGDPTVVHQWDTAMSSRAEQAKIPVEAYAAQHQPLKRTIILVTTTHEEV